MLQGRGPTTLMTMDKTQQPLTSMAATQRNISSGGAVPGKRRFKLQISRLPSLPVFTAIEFLSMTTSYVVPHHCLTSREASEILHEFGDRHNRLAKGPWRAARSPFPVRSGRRELGLSAAASDLPGLLCLRWQNGKRQSEYA